MKKKQFDQETYEETINMQRWHQKNLTENVILAGGANQTKMLSVQKIINAERW